MQHGLLTHALAGERDLEAARSARADRPPDLAAGPGQGPWSLVLDLQRSAGNAAVTRMLQGRGSSAALVLPFGRRRSPPTAPIAVARQADDDDEWGQSGSEWSSSGESDAGSSWGTDEEQVGSEWSGGGGGGHDAGAGSGGGDYGGGSGGGESAGGAYASEPAGEDSGSWWESGGSEEESDEDSGSSWWPFGGGDEESEGDSGSSWWPFGGDEESGEESEGEGEEGEHSESDMERKLAEGESGTESDVYVPTGGGPPPYAASTTGGSGFHDGGRRGTVPFGDGPIDTSDPDEALRPHAFTGGGRTGSAAWAGGGPGKGPKGNQGSGSIDPDEVVPEYDSSWGGMFSDADAWVRPGTGVVNVHRDYITSNAGDQGNGWWISAAAASALEAHEQRHVASSKNLYESDIQPALDRIAVSATTGKGKTYWQSDARALLKRQIGWEGALTRFKEEDMAYNGNQGQIDSQDYGSSGYPRNQKGPRKIQGKDYDNYLIMGSEPDPT